MNTPLRRVALAVMAMIVLLLANYILVALLLRISHAARAPAASAAPRKPVAPLAEAHTEMVQRP